LVAAAMKSTDVPLQTLMAGPAPPGFADKVTNTGNEGFTVMITESSAGFGKAQFVALDTILTFTSCPLVNVLVV